MKASRSMMLLCLALLSKQSLASMNEIKASNNLLTIQATNLNMDYAETDSTGALLDTEKGFVPGRLISLTGMWGRSNGYFHLQYCRNDGSTEYVGGTLSPPSPYGSVVARSGAIITDYSVRFGTGYEYAFPGPRGGYAHMLTPYLELGRHEWNRDVNAGEIYHHNFYGLGLMWQMSEAGSNLVYTIYGLAGRTSGAWIDVVPSNAYVPAIPSLNVELGNSPLYRAGIAFDYALTPALHLNAGVDYEQFAYGISEKIGGAWEPDSTTKLLKYKAGLGFSF